MSALAPSSQRKILDEFAREGRLGAPLLRRLRAEFDVENGLEPARIGQLYEEGLAQEKAKQRASGSFFTPSHLVEFVLQHSLKPAVLGLSLREIYRLRILDPSCGGGAFLLGTLEWLENHCVEMGATPGVRLRRRLAGCLVGVDLDADAIDVCRAAIRMAVGGAATSSACAELIVGDALLPETDVGEIDLIVGNPPWGQKGLHIDGETRERYKSLFTTARGVWDPFKFFVERCHQILSPGGRWGLILPDIILLKDLQSVRDVILDGSAIDEIAHCGRAFEGANIDAVAMCATRVAVPVAHTHQIRVFPALTQDWQTLKPSHHRQRQRIFHQLPGHKFNLYLHGAPLRLYRRLRSLERLGDRAEMHEGVHSGNSRKKLFVDARHNKNCQPMVLGRSELAPYLLRWAGGWIDTSPNLLDRDSGEYANLGKAHWHNCEKIVVRRTGDRVIAAHDQHGYYVSNNMFVLLPGVKNARSDREEQLALVALLNSRFMTWYFRAIQPRAGRLFAELKLVHLRDFPLPKDEHWQRALPRLAELADLAGKGPDGAEGEVLFSEINQVVETAFEISPAELEVIRLTQCSQANAF